jgi:murein DD-endopeptidase MepM/ murein hydrolase activator NlpD
MPQLTIYLDENNSQRRHLDQLEDRIDQIYQKMDDLKTFDQKLKVIAKQVHIESEELWMGIGGSDLTPTQTQSPLPKDTQGVPVPETRNIDSLYFSGEIVKQYSGGTLEGSGDAGNLLASLPSMWPVRGWLNAGFGYRMSPLTGEREFHNGLELSSRLNAPVMSPSDGVVTSVSDDPKIGKTMSLDHGYGLVTKYGYLQRVLASKGQHVKRGEVIALVGIMGPLKGPGLHYEIHLNKVPVDPARYTSMGGKASKEGGIPQGQKEPVLGFDGGILLSSKSPKTAAK